MASQAPKRNTVGTTPAARRSVRVRSQTARRETHGELVAAYSEAAAKHVEAAPLALYRWWVRWWDYTSLPTALPALWTLCGVLRLAAAVLAPVPILGPIVAVAANAGRLAPVWLLALVAAAVWWWTWTGTHRTRARKRWLVKDGAEVRDLFTPRYETIDIERPERGHRRTDYGRTPRGYSVGQYAEQQAVAQDSLGHPVTIRTARPGVVAITQLYEDLMAEPVPWREALETDPHPDRLWLGLDRDAHDVYAPLTKHGSGLAWLLAGAPGSGKSAEIQALLAQVIALPPQLRRLWIIDPADGVDLGCWHPFAHRNADNPKVGLALLRELIADMETRRVLMAAAGVDVCVPSEQFPWNVLVIDELPELTLNEERKARDEACELLARIRRVGRKTNTSILAITQDMSVPVVPAQIRKIFSHRLCFKVSTYAETDMILPGARRHGYHPEAFDPDHPGRFILWDLSTYTEARGVGLYGAQRHEVVHRLSTPRPLAVQAVTGHSPNGHRPVSPAWPPPIPHTETDPVPTSKPPAIDVPSEPVPVTVQRSAHDLRVVLHERGKAAGRLGLNAKAVAEEIGEDDRRVRRALNHLKFYKRGGSFIHPEVTP